MADVAAERLPEALAAALEERLAALAADDVPERLWEADPSLWKPDDEAHQKVIANALGWLSVFEGVRDQVEGLSEFVAELRAEGYRSAVLLGMGGSSLAPEVLRAVLGTAPGYLELHVLDSTDPAAVAAVEAAVDLETTLFIVASKSGGTTETASFHSYFHERLLELDGAHAGHHFVAITDEGTSLERQALEQGFRAVFINPGDIGGRYSALSFFGLVPAALIGVDLGRLLDGVRAMAVACGPDVPGAENPALRLGAALGELARHGRDKLTLLCEPPLAAFGAWVEQLVAESTGKEATGILPVDLEELGPPGVYGDDRVFAALRLAGGPAPRAGALAA
ncbi:MAG: transaldolase, partial [Thermoleophilia bacterium]